MQIQVKEDKDIGLTSVDRETPRRESVYARGVKSGIYTQEQKIEIVVFYSHEDEGRGAMFPAKPGLSAFGETPEHALKEFWIMLQGALDSGLEVHELAKANS